MTLSTREYYAMLAQRYSMVRSCQISGLNRSKEALWSFSLLMDGREIRKGLQDSC